MSPNHSANRRGANPQNANVQARPVPVLGALVPSRSNPTQEHLVAWSAAGGPALCSCEGWRATGRCYHVRLALEALATKHEACPSCGGPTDRVADGDSVVLACSRCEWALVQ